MEKIYNYLRIEEKNAKFWKENNFFIKHSNLQKPFSIIMPPPNLTGKLHIGHAWDYALQDLIIRYKKLSGYDVLYVPGLDHAGVATQAKVEAEIWQESKQTRYDLGKDKLIEKMNKFVKNNANIIHEQWSKLGLAIEQDKEFFTLDDNLKKIVTKIFVNLYNQNLIYRGTKIISWDVKQSTALSNIEVEHRTVTGKMYYFKYFLKDTKDYLEVATTRPETMFADQALVINTKDERYKKYFGKEVYNPVNDQLLPIIFDDYVDMSYGTGVMKCTPAHDLNDYNIAIKHHLNMPICINIDGTLNELANEYNGLDRFIARNKIIDKLQKKDLITKIEDHLHNVGFSQRTNTIVEPILSKQWFISMKKIALQIIKMQKSKDKINFFPKNFNDNLIVWMKNIEDWCISRQIWWGHQIPVWYHKTLDKIYIAETPPNDIKNWIQDLDVLDTWFSSSLLSFAGLGWNFNNKIFTRFFPSDVLVTGYDIIFFWVSRMIFQTINLLENKAFKNVLIHGLIRDEKGLKMSKSLGNGIDPMDIISKYGADTLRFFLLTNSSPGQDLKYNVSKVEYAWSFINKLWNAARFVLNNICENFKINFNELSLVNDPVNSWILFEFENFKKQWMKNMDNFEFSLAGLELINFFWNKYCSWYIEFVKINLASSCANETINILVFVLNECLKMLHPYIPFVTEEIYQMLNFKKSILIEKYYQLQTKFEKNIDNAFLIIGIINKLREFRAKENISSKILQLDINIVFNGKHKQKKYDIIYINKFLSKLINVQIKDFIFGNSSNVKNIVLSCDDFLIEIITNESLTGLIYKNLKNELDKLEIEIIRSEKILANKNFLNKADPQKVQLEQEKLSKYKYAKEMVLSKIIAK